jgi:signal transduction histidine kinase
MNIRTRITLQFFYISSILLFITSISIYFYSSEIRKKEFYERLSQKAHITAQLFNRLPLNDIGNKRINDNLGLGFLPEEAIYIYNNQDVLVYQSSNLPFSNYNSKLINRIKSGEHKFHFENDIDAYGYAYFSNSFVIIATAVDKFGLDRLNEMKKILVLVFIFGNVIAALFGWFFAGRSLKPLFAVVAQVNNISVNQLNKRVEIDENLDVVALIASTFNELLDRVEVAFQMQKQFVASASHELRTPLTIILGQLELALLNTRTPEQYQKIINSLTLDLKDLNNTANRLLLLAQADFQVENLDPKPFRIDECLWQINLEMQKRFPAAIVDIHFDLFPESESDFIIMGNEQLVKVAISNVVENSLKYSNPQYCSITLFAHKKGISIKMEDQGYGIDKDDIQKIFIPFYRANSSFVTSGHGLGLAMVKKIIQLHSGVIDLKSEINKGTIVSISIPRILAKSSSQFEAMHS